MGLLTGLNVLEIGGSVAAAFCGKCLADQGAEVTVIERPAPGSGTPMPASHQEGSPGADDNFVHSWLTGSKQTKTLCLEDERDRPVFCRLLREAAVLIESMGEDALLECGWGYDDLRAENKALTVVSITPFGRNGPYVGYQANDLTLFAMSGFAHYLVCPVDDPPSTPPKPNPGYQVSLVTGLLAASATLWAVFAGRRKGEGITVDVSEWEAFAHLLYEQVGQYSEGSLIVGRNRVEGAGMAVAGGLIWCLPCSDGWVIVSPREDHQFRRWSEVMGSPEWTTREEFATAEGREERAWEIHELSASWTRSQRKLDVFNTAQALKVPCFPVSLLSDLPQLEQLRHREFFTQIEHPMVEGLRYPDLPFKVRMG